MTPRTTPVVARTACWYIAASCEGRLRVGRCCRRRVPIACAAATSQRVPVNDQQLLALVTDEHSIVTGEELQPVDCAAQTGREEPAELEPEGLRSQTAPYNAEKDWDDRFGHYGR